MKPGDKVVCIDDSPCRCGRDFCTDPLLVTKGCVYVIESTYFRKFFTLVLIGVPARLHHARGTNACRFRLLDEMKKEAKVTQAKGERV